MVLRYQELHREVGIRVVGQIGSQGDAHTYGIAFVDDSLDFWQVEFPPPPAPEERPLELVLECGGCRESVTLLNGDYEFDVCAIHGGLVRYCTECGFATVWRRPQPGSELEPHTIPRKTPPQRILERNRQWEVEREWEVKAVADTERSRAALEERMELELASREESVSPPVGKRGAENAQRQEAPTVTTAVEERRQRVRAKVNYFACVKSEIFGSDIVACIDMSRGGLGFRTRNAYELSAEVTIAVPFSPESPNAPAIFVAAKVVNIAEMPERKMFRCGVMFLPAGATPKYA
jgi:hypothetical protein